eukprot:TRINITY_DN9124_c0_g1_i2.p1 TRINITY_DN9124_c0_g1~~TRINITY_DN9124_c0_g1_i2.p1  ORF type:complete len:395 (+),score=150.42 TRINITY_DN9124_c0_g1_i2:62-1186(+)
MCIRDRYMGEEYQKTQVFSQVYHSSFNLQHNMEYKAPMSGDSSDPMTLSRHIIQTQQKHKEAHGDFTILINAIAVACKYISSKVRRAGLVNLYGAVGSTNTTGDVQKKLDVLSNEVFVNTLKTCNKCAIMASEEEDQPITVDVAHQGKYVLSFDPLDGSSNIDANVSIGSIFGVWKKISQGEPGVEDLLQKGDDMVAAGYCLYGTSTQLVLSLGEEVNGYTLDPSIGEFLLTHPNIKIPKRGVIYSINEGNAAIWEEPTTKYVQEKKFPAEGKKTYSLRYIGSMVADVHRTLLYGGIFLYPADKKTATGKLRVLYECAPMSYIVEKAGGKSVDGFQRILEIQPKNIHQKSGIILGSPEDVDEVMKIYAEWRKNK